MLDRYGFGDRWRKMDYDLYCYSEILVLVNGSPSGFLMSSRGLEKLKRDFLRGGMGDESKISFG